MSAVLPRLVSEWFERARNALPAGLEIYLVGGAVRDGLLGLASHDLDFVLPGDAARVARTVANKLGGAYYLLDDERGAGRVILDDQDGGQVMLDFSRLRGQDLYSDLRARDFTLNAMAVAVQQPEALIDPLGGRADLKARRLRACASSAFQEDPLRILRAARLAETFQLRIDKATLAWLKTAIPGLQRVSPERRRDELFRILEGGQPRAGLARLVDWGAAEACFPGLATSQFGGEGAQGWTGALARVGNLIQVLDTGATSQAECARLFAFVKAYRQWVDAHLSEKLVPGRSLRGLALLAAVYQGFGKTVEDTPEAILPAKRSFEDRAGRQLMLSNPEIERWHKAVWASSWIIQHAFEGLLPSKREVYRYFKDAGAGGVEGCLLALAAIAPQCGFLWAMLAADICQSLLAAWFDQPETFVRPPHLVDGNDLQRELGIAPGPRLGVILEEIHEAQAGGLVSNRAQAITLARHLHERG